MQVAGDLRGLLNPGFKLINKVSHYFEIEDRTMQSRLLLVDSRSLCFTRVDAPL